MIGLEVLELRFQARIWGNLRRLIEGCTPSLEAFLQGLQVDAAVFSGIPRKVPPGALQQRPAANLVSARIMMKGDCDLDQPLQELAFRLRSLPPDILKDLVGVKELGGVEQGDAVLKSVAVMHLCSVAQSDQAPAITRQRDDNPLLLLRLCLL
jgi:hypothetical protein